MRSGGVSILFLHLWRQEASRTGRQTDRPAIVILLGVPYQMLLKKGLGLEALGSLKYRLMGKE